MRTPLAAVLTIVLTFGCTDTPVTSPDAALDAPDASAGVQTLQFTEEKVPAGTISVFVPCANGGAGELVVASDVYLHILRRLMLTPSDVEHQTWHVQPWGNWNGIGQETGDVYQVTRPFHETFTIGRGSPVNSEFTHVSQPFTFSWIGPGPGNNLTLHAVFHSTRNHVGEITVFLSNTRIECK